ncbi:MAG: hypothetical protein ACREUQ_01940, partial [Burkholderiales bacterium]
AYSSTSRRAVAQISADCGWTRLIVSFSVPTMAENATSELTRNVMPCDQHAIDLAFQFGA